MNLIAVKLTLAAALLYSDATRPAATCHPLSPTGATLQKSLESIVSSPDGLSGRLRATLSLEQGPASSVTLVTDSTVCTSLANAEAIRLGRASRTSILAFAIGGSHFAVLDKGEDAGEFESMSVYDARFAYIVSMTF
jgi:hypothetical protein